MSERPQGRTPEASIEEEARAQISALEREAKALGNEPSAALLFHHIGLLWEDPLHNPPNAAVAYQKAYRLSPKFLANLRAARRLFADVGNAQMVVQLLEAEIAATEEPLIRASLLLEKAQVLEERLSRETEAVEVYRSLLELAPKDLGLLTQLEAVFSIRNDAESLVKTYRLFGQVVEEPAVRAHYLTAAGLLLSDRLSQPEEASALFREAFTLDRKNPLLLASIQQVAEREGLHEELLAALAAEAELSGVHAAPVYLRIAKVYESLGRQEDALAALVAARRTHENDSLVLSELARSYERLGRFEDLAEVLLSWVNGLSDEQESVAQNLRLAAIYEEELKRDADAGARYQAILQRLPGHTQALSGLGKLHHRNKNWEALLGVFEAEAAAAEDPKQRAARLFKAAELLEEKLGRTEEAMVRYQQCLQLQPSFLAAQKALIRLFESKERYPELIGLYEQDLLQTTDRDLQLDTLHKIAAIYDERLSDLPHAVDALKRARELVPDHLPTLSALSRLYARSSQWESLWEVQDKEAELVQDTKQVLLLLQRNAELREEHLKDVSGAIASWERLLSISPSYIPALKTLGRLYAQQGRFADLIRMYRAEAEITSSQEHAAAISFRIGELYEQRLKDPLEAAAAYRQVLELDPRHFPSLRALFRIYRAQSAWEPLIGVLREEAALRADPADRAHALFLAATVCEESLNDPVRAIALHQEVLALDPAHPAALHALCRLHAKRAETKELIAVLERQTQTSACLHTRAAAYLQLARIHLDVQKDPARAAAALEALLAQEPGHLSALKLLERIRAADRPRRGELRAKIAERMAEPHMRGALRLASALDLQALPNPAESGPTTLDPADPRLAFAMERALKSASDHRGLAALWSSRLQAVSDPWEKVELLLRLGLLFEQRLGDFSRAQQTYRQALELDHGLLPALHGLCRVSLKLSDNATARQALETEGRCVRDCKSAAEALLSAAQIAEDQKDLTGAEDLYQLALEKEPLNPVASERLASLLRQRGDAADLATTQEKRAAALGAQRNPSAADEFVAAASTCADLLHDAGRAQTNLEKALAINPNHLLGLELTGRLCGEAKEWSKAASALAHRVQLGGEVTLLSGLHLRLGAIYQDYLGDATRAAAHLQTALAADPRSAEALERLSALHLVARNWTAAVDCLKRLLALELSPLVRVKHTLALADIMDQGFGDPEQASALYRQTLELAPGDPATVDRLVRLYERTGRLPELSSLLEEQITQFQRLDVRKAQALRLKAGELQARSLHNPSRAIELYRAAVDQDPRNEEALCALAELYEQDNAHWGEAVEAHRSLLRLNPGRIDSLHGLFRIWLHQHQTDRAFCAAALLTFLRSTTDLESAAYQEGRGKLPPDLPGKLTPVDLNALLHPEARGPALDALSSIGDQLSKLYPPNFEGLGVDRKADRLKPEHTLAKVVRTLASAVGVLELDVYQAKQGLVTPETTDPLSLFVGADVARRYNPREQRFLLARGVFALAHKTPVLGKLSSLEAANLVGNAVRIHAPQFSGLGEPSEEQVKQLRKACSRRALKALEEPAATLSATFRLDFPKMLEALKWSQNQLGLCLCGDPAVALSLLLREESLTGPREPPEALSDAVARSDALQELFCFAISEDLFRARQTLGMALA